MEQFFLPSLRRYARFLIKRMRSQGSLPGTKGLADDEITSRFIWSNLDNWGPMLRKWVSGYRDNPDREGREVEAYSFAVDLYSRAHEIIPDYKVDAMVGNPALNWGLSVNGVGFRDSTGKSYNTESLAENYFAAMPNLRFIHRNENQTVNTALSLAYSVGEDRYRTSYPDYIISYLNHGRVTVALVEVKEIPVWVGGKLRKDDHLKTERIASVYAEYSKVYGIPACVMVEHDGEHYAYLGNGEKVLMREYLGRKWVRSLAGLDDGVSIALASSKV